MHIYTTYISREGSSQTTVASILQGVSPLRFSLMGVSKLQRNVWERRKEARVPGSGPYNSVNIY